MPDRRIQIHHCESAGGTSTFPGDVRRGLSADPKYLLPKYLYDPMGTHLFEAICLLPEYYLTRAEREILSTRMDEILPAVGEPRAMIELGSGSSGKTRLLLKAILRRRGDLLYRPIDISSEALARSGKPLVETLPGLRIEAYSADYETALDAMAREAGARPPEERSLAIFLGSSIGNLDPPDAQALFARIRGILHFGDAFLLGADLKKSSEVLVAAYNDPLGVTAAFILNLLVRINRELGGEFRIDDFKLRSIYEENLGRMELYIESRRRHSVRIQQLGLTVGFERGEQVHTENSYKYDLGDIRSLAEPSGFELEQSWFDSQRRFSLNLLRAV